MADKKQAKQPADKPAGSIIQRRPRVGPFAALLIALGFALLATPIVMGQAIVSSMDGYKVVPGKPSPITVRIPQFAGYAPEDHALVLKGGSIVVSAGHHVDANKAAHVEAVRADQRRGAAAWFAYFVALLMLGMLFTAQFRRSHLGKLYRTMVVTMALMLLVALTVKVLLMFTTMSSLIVPVGAAALIAAMVVDLSAGMAVGLTSSILVAFLVPFDLGGIAVLVVQGLATVLILGDAQRNKRGKRHVLLAGAFGGVAAATAYLVIYYLALKEPPIHELSNPLSSAWLAAGAGGLLSGAVAILVQPLYQFLLGDITRNKLVELEDLSNPLLKQIAEKSPGTWQHSLAMANMSEIAANAIGGNGRLVRVGAYYHDLGKSLQSNYFIENLSPGETSPHDRLAPEVSCDAIFAHVTEGVRLGRENGLPERVIDFMHMHHGDGYLEYFWAKCVEQDNPNKLSKQDFRYPGIRPQSRETAILAICDAVEAASRTLKKPDEAAIRTLVQRIVYGKLHLGQLDESGMSMADLRMVSDSLFETIKAAFHGRIEYPWQREERERLKAEERGAATTAPETPVGKHPAEAARAQSPLAMTVTQRMIDEPRLDSLDAPRPYWRGSSRKINPAGLGRPLSSPLAVAPTERVSSDLDAAPGSSRPGTTTDTILLTQKKRADESPSSSTQIPQADPAASSSGQLPQQVDAVASAPLAAAAPVTTGIAAIGVATAGRALPKVTQPFAPGSNKEEPQSDFTSSGTNPGLGSARAPSSSQEMIIGAESQPVATPAPTAQPESEPDMEERITAPRPVAQPEPELSAVKPPPSAVDDDMNTNVRKVPKVPKGHRMSPSERRAAKRRPPPPPGSPGRAHPTTIPLMGDDVTNVAQSTTKPIVRAETNDPELNPGVMVLGPPPATLSKPHKAPRRDTTQSSTPDDFDESPTLNPARRSSKHRE